MSEAGGRSTSAARAAILGRIGKSLGVRSGADEKRAALVAQRLASPPRLPPVARVTEVAGAVGALFRNELERSLATVVTVADDIALPAAVAGYLRAHNQPLQFRCGGDEWLARCDWPAAGLTVARGPASPDDTCGLSMAVAGVAETGTLVLASGPANPVTLAFLPETHVVVVAAGTIVGTYEEAYDLVRSRLGTGRMPRTLNLISGPSRTADIGGRIVIGAHGPRRMGVFIVG